MTDFLKVIESTSPKVEILKQQLKQFEPVGFDFDNFKVTLSSISWELKNEKQPEETTANFLKRSENNGKRILYTSNKHKPIFEEESEFGIAEKSTNDFFVEIPTENVQDAIRQITSRQDTSTQGMSLDEIATAMNGRCKTKVVHEEGYDLRIINFEIPVDTVLGTKIYARMVQSKSKNDTEFKTQSQILFVKIPCKDFAEYLQG